MKDAIMKDDAYMNDGSQDTITPDPAVGRSTASKVSGKISSLLGGRSLPKPQLKRWWIGGTAVVLLLAYTLWPSGSADEATFRTVGATRGALTVTVSATGTLQPVNTVEVGAEISGLIETVLVDYNAPVTKGQVLAMMDTDNLNARVAQTRASVAAARARVVEMRATVEEAKVRLGRIQELYSRGNASKQELEAQVATEARARAALVNAQAQVDVAVANLAADETNLGKAQIKSPIDGLVLMRQVEPGQTVAASLQTPVLFSLAENLTAMELIVDIDEADIGQVKEGQKAEFTVAAFPDRKFPASISQVRFSPKAVEGVVTYQAVLVVDNSELVLRPGMTATASIVTITVEDSILVPATALRFQPPRTVTAAANGAEAGGSPPGLFRFFAPSGRSGRGQGRPSVRTTARTGDKQNVWVLAGGQPRPLPVTVGPSDGQFVSVSGDGIQEGTQVIIGIEQTAAR